MYRSLPGADYPRHANVFRSSRMRHPSRLLHSGQFWGCNAWAQSVGPVCPASSCFATPGRCSLHAAKNFWVTLRLVGSNETVFAPFSQSAKDLVCFVPGDAYPEQSKPSGWFIDSRALEHFSTMLCSRKALAVAYDVPQLLVGLSYGSRAHPLLSPSTLTLGLSFVNAD
jgi:hypothetical protein